MHSKNEPTLLDTLLAKNMAMMRKYPDSNILRLREAQRFVLDEDASFMVGALIKRAAPLILRQHEFARPPFDPTWVEMNFPAYIRGLEREPSSDESDPDWRVGYFFGGGNVIFAVETRRIKPMIMPYWFQFHRTQPMEEELALATTLGLSRHNLRQTIMGMDGLTEEWLRSAEGDNFFSQFPLIISPTIVKELGMSRANIRDMLTSGAGSLKQAVTLALLLTRPGREVVHLTEVGHRRAIVRGKAVTLLSHHKLTLHLAVPKSIAKVVDALHTTGEHHRYHAVRGHWAQTRRKVAGCQHDWEPITVNRYHCLRCPAKRWWRTDHHRGDLSLGEVTKSYEVKK